MEQNNDVKYLVFDIETVADEDLIKEVKYPHDQITPREARKKFTDELIKKKDDDFIPYTFQFPVTLAMAKLREDFTIIDLPVLTFEQGGPGVLVKSFWAGWERYKRPTLVTFNGKGFDLPVMEHMAFRYGIPIPGWMKYETYSGGRISLGGSASANPRNRYNTVSHIDVMEILSNFRPYVGGMNLAAKGIGCPGKIETNGQEVQEMFDQKRFAEIHDYCRCDVLDTYFLFLRLMTLSGCMGDKNKDKEKEKEKENVPVGLDRERILVDLARKRIEQETANHPIYNTYLEAWSRSRGTRALDEYCRQVQQ
ncbi:MAG: 3'-5' exonuclease [Thermoguttaceae bacterium]|nr:3'-5' exonuclease [Thermoguttaceae bacterium]